MAGRREPPSEADGDDGETAGDSESQAGELHVQVSDLRRAPYDSAALVPLTWLMPVFYDRNSNDCRTC
ncbi:MAG TPA: hypothetical protein VFX24_00490 [Ktedonobacterales bacterium]|jgi:hypothetical protein|nr:hypothetical protein [Ktedonobacterales bacterium]